MMWMKTNGDGYDEDLRRRQREHLERVRRGSGRRATRCLHDGCSKCVGTGVKADGSACVHMISCPCPRCLPATIASGCWGIACSIFLNLAR